MLKPRIFTGECSVLSVRGQSGARKIPKAEVRRRFARSQDVVYGSQVSAPTTKSEADDRPGEGRGFGWVWITGVILILYVLSVGPMCRLNDKGLASDRLMRVVYAPLVLVAQKSGAADAFLRWYCKTVWKTRC